MKEDKDIKQRPEAYPKPTQTDHQLKNQDEFIQVQNDREDDQIPQRQENNTGERERFNDFGRGI
ncbi:hypothetical protein OCK74_00795 [Chitinophagaceae bacterium LB-8]|uniref:Uncharacterized protein n=1 Tax=Paraflavisolibacter caeni TaxID=2982496 RepID=A0A9X2XTY6_9BACT|nr:hypothetical protein [Paraflavisolibacter caeni]MCU7547623.1 hypothetical protein [Paraflavisolibacter caeni]